MAPERVVLSWSGGKDSTLALAALRADPAYEVVGLLTSITSGYDRVSIHGVRRALVEAQAAALGLPLHEINLVPATTNAAYEDAFAAALNRVRAAHPGVRAIAFGDIFLADVREYREQLVEAIGFRALFPLWGSDASSLARGFIASGYQAKIVCVDTQQLSASFAGRDYNTAFLTELPHSADACGERGEFHTFVWAGPIFGEAIPIEVGRVVLREDRFAFCDLMLSGAVAMQATTP